MNEASAGPGLAGASWTKHYSQLGGMLEMSDFTADSNAPMTGRTIAAGVAKIPPVIIVAATALGAYQAAPMLVEYFKPSRPLYMSAPAITPLAPPEIKPVATPAPEPATEPVQKQVTPPAAPPILEAAPVATVALPRIAAEAAPTDVLTRPALRGQSFRARSPRLQFGRGLSGFRGSIHLGHVVQVLHFARRFHR